MDKHSAFAHEEMSIFSFCDDQNCRTFSVLTV